MDSGRAAMFHVKHRPGAAISRLPGPDELDVYWRPPPAARPAFVIQAGCDSQVTSISLVGLLLAVGVGLLHAVVSPSVTVAGVHPNLVLVGAVLVTAFAGTEASLAWAFASGLTANLLVREPAGAIPLGLLLVVGTASLLARLVPRPRWARVAAVALIGSFVADGAILLTRGIVGDPTPSGDLGGVLLAAALLNGTLSLLALAPISAMVRRFGPDRRRAW